MLRICIAFFCVLSLFSANAEEVNSSLSFTAFKTITIGDTSLSIPLPNDLIEAKGFPRIVPTINSGTLLQYFQYTKPAKTGPVSIYECSSILEYNDKFLQQQDFNDIKNSVKLLNQQAQEKVNKEVRSNRLLNSELLNPPQYVSEDSNYLLSIASTTEKYKSQTLYTRQAVLIFFIKNKVASIAYSITDVNQLIDVDTVIIKTILSWRDAILEANKE